MNTSTPTFDPQITVTGDRIFYRSAIRFRLYPESAAFVRQMREQRGKQVMVDTESGPLAGSRTLHERTTAWPIPDTDERGIVEMSFSGPVAEARDVKMMHDLHVASMQRVLNQSHGPAMALLQGEWLHLDPDIQMR